MQENLSLDFLTKEGSNQPGPGVIKLEYSLKLKIKRNDWLLADVGHVSANSQSLCFILSLRMNLGFITSGPDQ